MLLRIDFNGESIHTVKIVNFDNLVKLKAQYRVTVSYLPKARCSGKSRIGRTNPMGQ